MHIADQRSHVFSGYLISSVLKLTWQPGCGVSLRSGVPEPCRYEQGIGGANKRDRARLTRELELKNYRGEIVSHPSVTQ